MNFDKSRRNRQNLKIAKLRKPSRSENPAPAARRHRGSFFWLRATRRKVVTVANFHSRRDLKFSIVAIFGSTFDASEESLPNGRRMRIKNRHPGYPTKKKKKKNQGRAANAFTHLLRAHNFLKPQKIVWSDKKSQLRAANATAFVGSSTIFWDIKKFMPTPKSPKVDFCKNRSRTKNPQKWIFHGFWTDPEDFPFGRSRKRP